MKPKEISLKKVIIFPSKLGHKYGCAGRYTGCGIGKKGYLYQRKFR